ncbi:hypothetical protein IMY05_005G0138500 [Salix suchowensis]|nr:hypothetical protein IMY05_005G0138500 [Salix suchowensis]
MIFCFKFFLGCLMVCLLDPKGLSCERILHWKYNISLPRLSSQWSKLITATCLQVSVSIPEAENQRDLIFFSQKQHGLIPSICLNHSLL